MRFGVDAMPNKACYIHGQIVVIFIAWGSASNKFVNQRCWLTMLRHLLLVESSWTPGEFWPVMVKTALRQERDTMSDDKTQPNVKCRA